MKRSLVVVAGFLLTAFVAALLASAPGPASAAIEMRLPHPADLTHPVHLAAERMVKRIADRTKGELKITIFPNNALGAPPEVVQQVRLGVIDMMLLNPANIEAHYELTGGELIDLHRDAFDYAPVNTVTQRAIGGEQYLAFTTATEAEKRIKRKAGMPDHLIADIEKAISGFKRPLVISIRQGEIFFARDEDMSFCPEDKTIDHRVSAKADGE